MNQELVRKMVKVGANNRVTYDLARTLSEKLDKREQQEFINWLRFVDGKITLKENRMKRYGF